MFLKLPFLQFFSPISVIVFQRNYSQATKIPKIVLRIGHFACVKVVSGSTSIWCCHSKRHLARFLLSLFNSEASYGLSQRNGKFRGDGALDWDEYKTTS
jgi:hypothetical protein